jgi:hypothetical protein
VELRYGLLIFTVIAPRPAGLGPASQGPLVVVGTRLELGQYGLSNAARRLNAAVSWGICARFIGHGDVVGGGVRGHEGPTTRRVQDIGP